MKPTKRLLNNNNEPPFPIRATRIPSDDVTIPRPCLPSRHTRPRLRHDPDRDLYVCNRCGKYFQWDRFQRTFYEIHPPSR